MIKAVLLDFDGTLVHQDMLDVVCEIVNKRKESEEANQQYLKGILPGLQAPIKRINFLKGVTQSQINSKVKENPYLINGAKELVSFLNSKNIITILASGNIESVLEVYQEILGITYTIGSRPLMSDGIIQGISEAQFSGKNFKVDGIKDILEQNSIHPDETLAIGDSIADQKVFELARISIAINPKGNIKKYATHVIEGDLHKAIKIIKEEI